MKASAALLALATLTTLALAGCQGEAIDRESTEQDLDGTGTKTGTTKSGLEAAGGKDFGRHHGPMDPAKMFARFDTDGDGKILLTELPERGKEHLAKADANGDGALTLAEMQAGHEKMKAEMFARADKNGDGKIAQGEVEAKHWSFIQAADTDADGLITKAELETAHAAGKLRPPPGERGHHAPSVEGMLEHFDANKDGKLGLAELPEHFRDRIQGSDANSDGILDTAELTAHVAEMKARFELEK